MGRPLGLPGHRRRLLLRGVPRAVPLRRQLFNEYDPVFVSYHTGNL